MPNYILIDPNNPEFASSYILSAGNPNCNSGGHGICYITAGDNGLNQPIITPDLSNAIIQSYVTGQSSPGVTLRS